MSLARAHALSRRLALSLAPALAFALPAGPLLANADWPQILGPNRNGANEDTVSLFESLPEEGLEEAWSCPVGHGFAGPVVAGQRCLIFHRKGSEALLEAFDALTGERQWSFSYQSDYSDRFGFDPGPRSCPTVAGDRVFIHGAEGMLHAVRLSDGEALWKRDLAEEFQSPSGFFGRCSAPLVTQGLVLLDIGGQFKGQPANIVAFEAATGELRWLAGDKEADYASPMLLTPDEGSPLALFFVREGFLGVDPRDGKIRFQEKFRSDIHASVNAASPVVDENRFFLSSCYGVGAGLWEWDPKDGLRAIYHLQDRLDCHFATPIHHQGNLYGFHGRQESGQEFRCLTWGTGEVRWREPMAPGSVILADGKLLILSERGELLVAEARPESWKLLFRTQVLGAETRALPALAHGHLYARDKRRLVCVRVAAP